MCVGSPCHHLHPSEIPSFLAFQGVSSTPLGRLFLVWRWEEPWTGNLWWVPSWRGPTPPWWPGGGPVTRWHSVLVVHCGNHHAPSRPLLCGSSSSTVVLVSTFPPAGDSSRKTSGVTRTQWLPKPSISCARRPACVLVQPAAARRGFQSPSLYREQRPASHSSFLPCNSHSMKKRSPSRRGA